MERFLKFSGIFIGLVAVTFLSLLIGLGKISPSQYVMRGGGSETLRVVATTSTRTDTPVSLPRDASDKNAPPASQGLPAKTTMNAPITTHVASLPPPSKASISTPGALIAPASPKNDSSGVPDKSGALNQNDITTLTNIERGREGLQPLVFNKRLAAMAEMKAVDMINKHYFAHVSPDGTDIAKLAATTHYQYLNLGENLALGDFRSSGEVVTGWMNSPGHRANILNKDFTEIGVAAVMGNYEGRMVWYSVQEFGRPMPDCPKPDTLIEQKIVLYETQITATETTLAHLRAEIETPGIDRETYDAKVKDYNTLVEFYNDLVAKVKADITTYNAGVKTYNACLGTET
jgi:uncharacterized protein YkwD